MENRQYDDLRNDGNFGRGQKLVCAEIGGIRFILMIARRYVAGIHQNCFFPHAAAYDQLNKPAFVLGHIPCRDNRIYDDSNKNRHQKQ